MSDRLAVMSEGRIRQMGTPREVYEMPADAYVADFLGVSNMMEAEAEGTDGEVRLGDFRLRATGRAAARSEPVTLVIRPERVRVEEQGGNGDNRMPGMVERTVYVGSTMQVIVRLPTGQALQAMIPNRGEEHGYRQGTPVTVHLPPADLRILEHERPHEPERGENPEPSGDADRPREPAS